MRGTCSPPEGYASHTVYKVNLNGFSLERRPTP